MTLSAMAAGAAASGLALHLCSAWFASFRCRKNKPPMKGEVGTPPVTIVQPLCGVEPFSRDTLTSIFALDYPEYEILFCLADGADPIAPLVRGFIEANPQIPARLLIGDDRISSNPKLNNVVKGWRAARHDWIIMADSNVLMPKDYVTRLLSRWREDTGIVCAPPIGADPVGFFADLECAFLNTYQARWQYAGEAAGFGFAQGKSMLWRREVMERGGGIEALGLEIAEDAASTKLVHRIGLRAHLVDRPFQQPLGRRRFKDVWKRQLRWARLRRATFPAFFAPEIVTCPLLTFLAAGVAAQQVDMGPGTAVLFAALIWYSVEATLAVAAGWPLGRWTPLAWIARDFLLPWLWVKGWTGDNFEWRGNAMTVGDDNLATDEVK